MPVQSTDTTTEIVFTADNQTWLIKPNVSVMPSANLAVAINHTGDLLLNYGMLVGDGERGVLVNGGNSASIFNEAGGLIGGSTAIEVDGNFNSVNNAGAVQGSNIGIYANGYSETVVNAGSIYGAAEGVHFLDTAATSNGSFLDNSGTIQGDNAAVTLDIRTVAVITDIDNAGLIQNTTGGFAIQGLGNFSELNLTNTGKIVGDINVSGGSDTVTNAGSIRGDLVFADGSDSVTNTGDIQGDVLLGEGNNSYVSRGGTVEGTISSGSGNDTFAFGIADLTPAVVLDAGGGTDTLRFSVTGTIAANAFDGVTGIETVVLAKGAANAIVVPDGLVAGAGGHLLSVFGNSGNDTIDGSGVSAAGQLHMISNGGNDVLRGGGGNDTFYFDIATLNGSDTVAGGGGSDTLQFQTAGTIAATAFAHVTSVETIVLANGTNTVSIGDALVASASGARLFVTGGTGADTIDASAVTGATHRLVFNGQGGADTITAGAGADVFTYAAASDSSSTHYDTLSAVSFTADQFNVPGAITAIDPAVSHTLSTASFDTDMAAAASGHLAAHTAMLVTANAGTLSGETFLVVDVNGTAGYQANGDLVLHLVNQTGTLTTGDFV